MSLSKQDDIIGQVYDDKDQVLANIFQLNINGTAITSELNGSFIFQNTSATGSVPIQVTYHGLTLLD